MKRHIDCTMCNTYIYNNGRQRHLICVHFCDLYSWNIQFFFFRFAVLLCFIFLRFSLRSINVRACIDEIWTVEPVTAQTKRKKKRKPKQIDINCRIWNSSAIYVENKEIDTKSMCFAFGSFVHFQFWSLNCTGSILNCVWHIL